MNQDTVIERMINMHIHKFADECNFSEVGIGGTLPATEEYRNLLKKLHPKQILNNRLSIPLYRVKYSYLTVRKNVRSGEKYFFSLAGDHEDVMFEVEMKLEDWIQDENRRRPYRAISNVTILDIERVAYAELPL